MMLIRRFLSVVKKYQSHTQTQVATGKVKRGDVLSWRQYLDSSLGRPTSMSSLRLSNLQTIRSKQMKIGDIPTWKYQVCTPLMTIPSCCQSNHSDLDIQDALSKKQTTQYERYTFAFEQNEFRVSIWNSNFCYVMVPSYCDHFSSFLKLNI